MLQHVRPTRMVRSMEENLITIKEACSRLSVSRWALYRLIDAGQLTRVKLGPSDQSAVRVRVSEVERIIAEGVSKPEPLTEADVPEYQPLSWR